MHASCHALHALLTYYYYNHEGLTGWDDWMEGAWVWLFVLAFLSFALFTYAVFGESIGVVCGLFALFDSFGNFV